MEDADGEFLRTRVLDLATLLIAMKARTEVREACRASLGETRRKSWCPAGEDDVAYTIEFPPFVLCASFATREL